MKINPVAQGTGAPGQTLGNVDVGRTADPVKMERARAIARGEKVEQAEVADHQAERVKPNVRSIKMQTQRSVYRDEQPEGEAVQEEITQPSSNEQSNEQATVEATQPLSPQFAALAKEKRAAQVMKAEAQKLMDEAKQLQSSTADAIPLSKVKSDPLSILQDAGVLDDPNFYNALTERIIGGQAGINPEIQALRDEIKTLKEGVDKTFITKEEQAEEAALTEMLYEAENLAKDGDAYEMIRERNAYDRVLRYIHSTYKKTGRVLNTSEAMDKVENDLLSEAEQYTKIKKVQGRFAPQPPLQPQSRPNQMRTLTARDSATSTMSAKARAIAAFNGTLKK